MPTAAEPWFLVASIPDDDPASGVLFTATAYIVLNLIADILYVIVDPRIRVG